MRTSYNRENNEDSNVKTEKDIKVEEPKQLEGKSETENKEISVEGILNALENKDTQVMDTRLTLEEEFDYIFSDGLSDAVTTDFYRISEEIDEALEDDRLSRIEESSDDLVEDDDDIGNEEDEDIDEEEIDLNEDDYDNSDEDNNEDKKPKEKVVKSNDDVTPLKFNGKKVLIGTISAIVIVAGVTAGYKAISNRNSIEGLEKQITKLYTSSKKDDLKSNVDSSKIDKYYTKLDELGTSGETQSIRSELDTISSYIADRGILDEINSSSYDLNSNDMQSKLDKVKVSSMNYAVPSLTDSISSTIRQITEDYNYFISLRDELSLVSDYTNFDVKDYQIKINEVNHTVNKKELQDKLDSISKSIKLSETVEDIKNQSSQKIDEAVGEATNSFSEKLSEISDNIKDIVPNMIDAIKEFFSGDKSQGN